MKNGIRVQLQYKNYFKLCSINVYQGNYHKEIKSQRNGINIDFEIDGFYKQLTNKDHTEICEKHTTNNELIKNYKRQLSMVII